jgi:hypothetical protein
MRQLIDFATGVRCRILQNCLLSGILRGGEPARSVGVLMSGKIMASVFLCLVASVLQAADSGAKSAATAIIKANKVTAVEELIDTGAKSVDAAAAVIEVAALKAPRLLAEAMQGIAAVMTKAQFDAAVRAALAALGESSSAGQLVADISLQIDSAPPSVSGDADVAVSYERRSETPSPFEDGTEIKPGDPQPPSPGTPSLIEQLITRVLGLLGIDPPASPS